MTDNRNCQLTGLHGGAEALATAFLFVNDVQGNQIDALFQAMVELIHDRVGAARLGSIPQAVKQIVNILRFQCCSIADGEKEGDILYSKHVRTLTLIKGLAANSRTLQSDLGSCGAVSAVLSSLQLAVSALRSYTQVEKKLKGKEEMKRTGESVRGDKGSFHARIDVCYSQQLLTEAAINALAALCLACEENRALASSVSELETLVYISSCTYLPHNVQQLARHTLEILHTSNE